ncbi:DUF2442 domain-containing protein [bacterium]|nr:DUF2442 domain-containing protein [bacterium]
MRTPLSSPSAIAAKCALRCPGTDAKRAKWRLIDNGGGVHWPDLDEDIGVKGLVLGQAVCGRAECP